MINQIFNEDCLEGMKRIPDGSIDCIITDPPYWTTACKWDTVIDLDRMWGQLKRIIKPNWAIVLFWSEPFSSALRMSNLKMYKYDWVWNKWVGVNFMHCKKEPFKVNEIISVFWNKKINYYPQMSKRNKTIKKTNNIAGESSWYILKNDKYVWKIYDEKYPETIIEFSSRSDKRWLHPTQKPVALIEYLIKTYTNEWETVLDFTMWSWTTAIACINTNRNYIGFELDKWYYDIAQERIRNHLSK